jgi:hypothetical protein
MMLVETGLTLANEVEKTKLWEMFFAHGEKQSVVVTPSLLGETHKERLERGGLNITLNL